MPESNKPTYATTYGHYSLDWCRRHGIRHLEVWCIGNPRCTNRATLRVDALISKAGPATNLLTVARRARCTRCRRLGCFVQPEAPPAPGTPHYRAWVADELGRCQAFIAQVQQFGITPAVALEGAGQDPVDGANP